MYIEMYNRFLKEDFDLIFDERGGNFIRSGQLVDRNTDVKIPIQNYIPRFCSDDYCRSFGIQWNRFRNVQLDSNSGFKHSYYRLVNNTKWNLEDLSGKSVLECGSGPGRFTELFLSAGADVVAVDMSIAIDANLENNGNSKNLVLLQSDITEMPFFYGKFDYVFCYGVLQHTPDPEETFNKLIQYLRPGGKLSIDIYRKMFIPTPWSTPKYFLRPITKRMRKDRLLRIIEWYIPRYIDFDTIIRSIPKVGSILAGLIPIPCWNYINMGYSKDERIKHAVMDTFDALSPAYDIPKTIKEVRNWFSKHPDLGEVRVFYGSNGIVGNATKR